MSLRLRLVSAARGRGVQFAPESFTKMIASDSLNFPPELPRRVTSHSGPGDRLPRAAAGLGLPAARQPERRGIRVIIMIIPKLLRSIIGINELINTYYRPSNNR